MRECVWRYKRLECALLCGRDRQGQGENVSGTEDVRACVYSLCVILEETMMTVPNGTLFLTVHYYRVLSALVKSSALYREYGAIWNTADGSA
jgi:hypothetical protein